MKIGLLGGEDFRPQVAPGVASQNWFRALQVDDDGDDDLKDAFAADADVQEPEWEVKPCQTRCRAEGWRGKPDDRSSSRGKCRSNGGCGKTLRGGWMAREVNTPTKCAEGNVCAGPGEHLKGHERAEGQCVV